MRGDRNGKNDIGVDRMRIGIDLLWVRVGICGGTESFIRNLLTGLSKCDTKNEYILFVSRDNAESFGAYERQGGGNMRLCVCPVGSANRLLRILWENTRLARLARRQRTDIMFIPVYSMPWIWGSEVPYVCVIHDMQALHYPQYFSAIRRLFLKNKWKYVCKVSSRIVVTSQFCRTDLERHYPVSAGKCSVIYDPVETKESGISAETLEKKYGIVGKEYFYCVSSMLPHKNLETLLEVMAFRKRRGDRIPLVLSGVGGGKAAFEEAVESRGIKDMIVDTGFVSDEERDCLYENCRLFLFPSVFEGFGRPPVEAMRRGKQVVMTRASCLEEVTQGKAVYVDDPYNVEEWMEKIEKAMALSPVCAAFEEYAPENVAGEYVRVFEDVYKENVR